MHRALSYFAPAKEICYTMTGGDDRCLYYTAFAVMIDRDSRLISFGV
jgi:hypothetical protein